MSTTPHLHREPLIAKADGTIKQVNPFSGTEVWTVPGRGKRPLSAHLGDAMPLDGVDTTNVCAFCVGDLTKTPPEKSRVVRLGDVWETRLGLAPEELYDSTPEFRRVPNLFEIVSYDYWAKNYGFAMDRETSARMHAYMDSEVGRAHVLNTVRTRLKAGGVKEVDAMPEAELLEHAPAYFGGGHDLIIGRRHYVDGATQSDQLAGAGTLTPDEHYAMIKLTCESIADLYHRNRYVPYVAAFQNWLKPAGASFDHLHKQLVAIDERSVTAEQEIALLRTNPNMYNEMGVDYAGYHNLVVAENDFGVVIAGIGHRYPTLEIYSRSHHCAPWLHSEEEMRGMSDLIHACHAAAGADVPCNEEWHHKPIDLDIPMPWRVNIKWRVSTLAGFEGGTKIYVNTLSPYDVRDRVVSKLYALRDAHAVADTIRIAEETTTDRNKLHYNPMARQRIDR